MADTHSRNNSSRRGWETTASRLSESLSSHGSVDDTTTAIRSRNAVSLASIMREQLEEDRKAASIAFQKSQDEEDEEEMLRIALERSMLDQNRADEEPRLTTATKPAASGIFNSTSDHNISSSVGPSAYHSQLSSSSTLSSRNTINAAAETSSQHLTAEELEQIRQAIQDSGDAEKGQVEAIMYHPTDTSTSIAAATTLDDISEDEYLSIQKAIEEADAKEEAQSLQLAMLLQEQERFQSESAGRARTQQGNVRVMTATQLAAEAEEVHIPDHQDGNSCGDYNGARDDGIVQAGFRMNSNSQQQWNRWSHDTVIGPDNEIRTKHDVELQGLANAHRLGLDPYMLDNVGVSTGQVGNRAYNSFLKDMKRSKKGVSEQGTGRAGSDIDGTRSGALDNSARLQISKAINSGLIDSCNGIVKEGKEAVIYHAAGGVENGGNDVAIKVFKRITEFRNRGSYVDGDPRFAGSEFNRLSNREQLVLWAEKEYRNLLRANRAGVPVASPILHKENMLFMRFMGNDGWPSPQLREVELKRGSHVWEILFAQVINAVSRLYNQARLVHADLSEYNIMVVPTDLVENKNDQLKSGETVQAVLIDFGQAVDRRHPDAHALLLRDISRVCNFFRRQGINVPSEDEVVRSIEVQQDGNGCKTEEHLKDL